MASTDHSHHNYIKIFILVWSFLFPVLYLL